VSTIAIGSGKGSPGATFVATNLAAAMARIGMEVVLLDVDPAGGDVCGYLGLDPRRGLYPLLRMEALGAGPDRLLAEAEEGSGFLAVCGFPEACHLASADTLVEVIKTANASGRTVIADIGRISEANASLAREADLAVLVVRPDLVSVLGAERAVRCLEGAGVSTDHLVAVVSGLDRRRPADRAEVADALGLHVLGAVPLDRRGARRALLAQMPATGRRLRHPFDRLAAEVRQALSETSPATEALAGEPVGVAT
jgi:MinD-like ATPase involved in chromosome partitioning or flagellar assembly